MDEFSSKGIFQEKLILLAFEKSLKVISNEIKNLKPSCFIGYCWEKRENYKLVHKVEQHLKLAGIHTLIDHRDGQESILNHSKRLISNDVDYVIFAMSQSLMDKLKTSTKKTGVCLEIPLTIERAQKKPGTVIPILLDGDLESSTPFELRDINYIDFRESKNYYLSVFKVLQKILNNLNVLDYYKEFERQYEAIINIDSYVHLKKRLKAFTELEKEDRELTHKVISETTKALLDKTNAEIKKRKKQYKFLGSNKIILNQFQIKSFVVVSFLILITGYYFQFKDNHFFSNATFYNLQKIFQGQALHIQHSEVQSRNEVLSSHNIRSDLHLPTETNLLQRPHFLNEIKEKLTGDEGIQTVALTGLGGAGKTTLARQYAQSQKSSIVWELNVETRESILKSFENLAFALAKTDEEQKSLRGLLEIKNSKTREEKIIMFVKKKLSDNPHWFLLYDNVDSFVDIKDYFPSDAKTWGSGKAILTSRNSNIQDNSHINYTIQIGELDDGEKLDLFTKIMGNGNAKELSTTQIEQVKLFLKNIPPFPLDISTAAYYITATNIPYEKYLEYLRQHSMEFTATQKDILKDKSDYTKTRYSIISLSVKQIMNAHPEFIDLLLLISLIDSQNIPRQLLEFYKHSSIIDNFIYNLKKYSFIISESSPSSNITPNFSIHRSTQAISLAYLLKIIPLEKYKNKVQNISSILEKYIDDSTSKEDFIKMKSLIPHCEAFRNHQNYVSDAVRGSISCKLGAMFYYLRQYNKAEKLLQFSHTTLNKCCNKNTDIIVKALVYLGATYLTLGENEKSKNTLDYCYLTYKPYFSEQNIEVAQILAYMGDTYGYLGYFEKAKNFLEKSLNIYKNNSSANPIRVARTLAFLGNVHLSLGNYENARSLLEKSLTSYKKSYSDDHIDVAWVLTYLGNTYGSLGDHEKAKNLHEQSVAVYTKYYPHNHADVIWASTFLGTDYRELGRYVEAQNLLEHCLKTYKEIFDEKNLRVAWVLHHLGNLYRDAGNYNDAKNVIEQSLIIYVKNFGEDHIKSNRVLRDLAKVYLMQGDLQTAESYTEKCLKVFQDANHPESYICLENLGELYLKKSQLALSNYDMKGAESFKNQGIDYLKKSLQIINMNFPKNSPHMTRIQSKLTHVLENE